MFSQKLSPNILKNITNLADENNSVPPIPNQKILNADFFRSCKKIQQNQMQITPLALKSDLESLQCEQLTVPFFLPKTFFVLPALADLNLVFSFPDCRALTLIWSTIHLFCLFVRPFFYK